MKKLNILILLLIIGTTFASAQIKKVPQDFTTIQSAIDAAVNGDTILVAAGTYFENIKFNGKNIVLTSNFIFSNNLSDIENTIINGSNPVNADTASCVRIVNGENSSAVLQGFTITGGKGTKWLDEHGAGLYREGGGILITLSSPTIRYNRIIFNEATNRTGVSSAGGGGIRIGDGNPLIENNIIAYNKARYGGGVVLNYTGGTLRNNLIFGNTGGEDFGGSGVWIYQNGPAAKYLINNTITENVSALSGCGVRVWSTSAVLVNNIVYNNSAPSYADLRVISGSINATYNNVGGGYTGVGNVSVDPLFATDYLLASNSPCVDAGDTASAHKDKENPSSSGNALFPSQGTIRNDMGAYGGPNAKTFPLIPTDVEEGFENGVPEEFGLEQNYPNPFNPTTKIKYAISAVKTGHPDKSGQVAPSLHVSLKVFDILGNEVATLVNEEKSAGEYSVQFDASTLTSGVYFYQLKAGEFSAANKMILMR